ncbi:MAG: hypothetical protein A2606_02680 [Candidatus Yanofskybacteria bacterium RIFOXYD1_FULL_42_10]|uniref:Glycosyl transferase family 1 domain-containing protein n=1 Tax=Candidatus Yanofskybacteria bacterium RIFOXYD1_FULL_42_10 TaxID=1802718 RepID=A0A1F8HVX4_9BACT|nr:MAG: hypothetical protein A2606_02680 [Candidatus Yanofskybacteria bacterium RIFOXYD1_FULL_42_10]
MINKHKIIVTGHPYAYPYYFKVFEYVNNLNDFVFVLPKIWKAKITINLKEKSGFKIYGAYALSYGRKSFLGGPFKGWMPGLAFLLPYLCFKQRARVLYSCSEPNLLTTLFNNCLAKFWGMKVILFTWQNIESKKRLRGLKLMISNTLVRFNLWLADGVICGNSKAKEIIRQFNAKIPLIICPLSGVDTERFKIEKRDEWKNKNGLGDKKLILFYGALDKRKGVEFLLRAFALMKVPNSFLIIIGTGQKKDKLKALAEELKISQSIKFFEWMPNEELPQILNSSEVFVYPSISSSGWEEQFGYAMAEAGACEIPVIATATGSIGEVIKDGVTGFLVPPNNVSALRAVITKLLDDPILSKQMGIAGRQYIASNFSNKVIADKIAEFLKSFS